jgi:hypothetical protein
VNKPVANWERGDNEACDLICQKFPDSNHIVAVIDWNGIFHIIHSSGKEKGVVIVPFAPWVKQHMVPPGYIRLTIGDK